MTAPDLSLRDPSDLDALLARSRSEDVLLFKHSTACPISARAHDEWETFLGARSERRPFAALVRVIEERPISRDIESRLGVRHESPQAILVRGGAAVAHLSHGAITADALRALAATA